MANSFDTPILITEVEDGRFRLYRGEGVPVGVPLRQPKSLSGLYQISGPLEAYYQLVPPQTELSRDDVLAWLQDARMLGCLVRDIEPPVVSRP